MTDANQSLRDVQVLVLEDDYYLATDLQDALEAAGATVVGPFASEADAKRAIAAAKPDCAFIDVNLGRGPSFEVPRALFERDVPFIFVTGYDAETIPEEFAEVPRFEKPVEARKAVAAAVLLLQQA